MKTSSIALIFLLLLCILADAGLLQGKRATASETDHIRAKGAIVSDETVVRDGNIITGNGPSASSEFAQAIVAALAQLGSSGEQGVAGENTKSAPSTPGSRTAGTESAAKWKCTVCGYIYDPAEHGEAPFEQLPSTWKCPTCGAPKSKFVKI